MNNDTDRKIALTSAGSVETRDFPGKTQDNPKYDAGYKQELSKPEQFIHFVQKYVKADWSIELTPEQVEECGKEYILEDYQKRNADLVYKIHFKTQTLFVYLIMELQSRVDFTMPFRLLTLIFALLLKIFLETPEAERERKNFRLPVVLPILFYNGEYKWTAETEFKNYLHEAQYFGEYSLNFKYYLVDLSRIENDDILNTNTLIDNILALDKNRKNERLFDVLDIVIRRTEALGDDDKVSFQKWLEYVLLASTSDENQETVRQVLEMLRHGKGGNNMIHGIQLIIRDEYNRGVQDGKIQGEEHGELRKLISLICKKLAKGKSPETIAQELEEDLSAISPIIEVAQKYAPDYNEELIYQDITASDVPTATEP